MKTKCVIYARVSTDLQQTKSQISDLKKYALNNDFVVVKEPFEESISGFIDEREQLESLKVYIKEHNIKQILCYELSRIGRSTLQTLKEIDYFTKENVNIYFKKENINTLSGDPSTKLLLSLLSSISELEVSTLKSRVARGNRESVAQGKRTGLMTIPYGYKADEKGFLIIDEEEAKIVRRIYDLALKEIGYRGIARELNSKGIDTRWSKLGRINKNAYGTIIPIKWKPNSIGIILKNTMYKGKRKYKNEYFDVSPIIDIDIWNQVQEINSKKPGINIKNTKYTYLLQGKVVCGSCGRHYGARTETRYNKEDSFYYCNGARDIELRCKNGQYSSQLLELGVGLLMFDHKDLMVKLREEEKANFNPIEKEEQVKYYTNEINNNLNKQKRLIDLRLNGDIDDKRFNKEKALIIGQNEGFKIKIKNIKDEIKSYDNALNIENIFDDYWLSDKQLFVDKYLNKVIIHKIKKVDLTEKQVSKLDMRFIFDDPQKKVKQNFIDKLITNFRKRVIFIEIFAFNSNKPLNAVIVNDNKYKNNLSVNSTFITPTLSINKGTLYLP